MWKQDESKDAYVSENGVQSESWWSKASSCSTVGAVAPGEQMDSLFAEYLHAQSTTEAGSEGKASAEDQTGPLRARFEHPHSIGSYIPPQVPGIEVTMSEGRHHPTPSWARQDGFETSGTPDILDGGSGSLKNFRDENGSENENAGEDAVAVAVAVAEGKYQGRGGGGEEAGGDINARLDQTPVGLTLAISAAAAAAAAGAAVDGVDSSSIITSTYRHYNSDASAGIGASASSKKDGELERTLSPLTLDSTADLNKPKADQLQSTSASPLPGSFSLVKPEGPNKQGSSPSSSSPVNISSPIASQHQPHLSLPYAPTPTLPSNSPSPCATTSTRLKPGYLTNSTARRSLSAVQQYRLLDERQAKRAPLWRRRVNYKSSLSDPEEMLATARTPQAYDIASPNTMTESMRYQAHLEPSHFLHGSSREQSATDHGDLFPLSPPLSSARSSFLCPNNNVAPHINGNYNLSTESLPSNVEANAINLLSRPHSMPQLQEQIENPYSTAQGRQYLHHSPSNEYLSPGNSFEDPMMKPQPPVSAYSGLNASCPVTEPFDLEDAEGSSSSAQGSSPQAWWGQGAGLELAQDGASMIYPASSTPSATPSAFTTLPNMSPKRRFNQTPSSDNLHNQLLMLQHQQQPRSPMLEQDRIYAFMNGQQTHSAMPSPPGSPGYYFGPQITSDSFCSPTNPTGVNFIDPFNNSGHHQPQHQQFNTFPRRTPLSKSMLGYDTPVQSTPPMPIRTVPSHASHSNGIITRSSYLRKSGSLGRSARMPPIGKNDPKEVSFVNFTPHDATKILSGVAPSGSSKTKARREREAQEKRRKLSEAAAAAVLAAGGDPSAIENIGF
ncbi:hypothetical protein TWF481_010685 [Arthrobotrys musiformis]|uniref:Developmental regulatory protein wetA n=1 Tax=Arthrobotrys musiformis TaxID=47236 RepID=A0AAV9W3C4_9PEZI